MRGYFQEMLLYSKSKLQDSKLTTSRIVHSWRPLLQDGTQKQKGGICWPKCALQCGSLNMDSSCNEGKVGKYTGYKQVRAMKGKTESGKRVEGRDGLGQSKCDTQDYSVFPTGWGLTPLFCKWARFWASVLWEMHLYFHKGIQQPISVGKI